MTKKYLLYIHNPEFALEKNKSAVVNGLLDDYYGFPPNVTLEESNINENTPSVGVPAVSASPGSDLVIGKAESRTVTPSLDSAVGAREMNELNPVFKFCKHGFPSDMCRYAKNGKPCRA